MGLAAFTLQLVALFVWSGFEAAHAVQGSDFVGFYQSWYLISHGVLNPPGWWQAQAIFIQWPLAVLGLIWPHRITLLLIQDVAIVGAELVAYRWICELVAKRDSISLQTYCFTGLALLALNPWIYWSASWDYHSESLGTLFMILAIRDLMRARRLAWLWCLLTLLSGLVPATYLVGIGFSLLIKHRRRLAGLAVMAVSAAWFMLMIAIGAGRTLGYAPTRAGSTLRPSGSPSGGIFASRAPTFVTMLSHHALDLLANVAPSGLVGLFAAPVLGVAGVVVGENFSQGNPNSVVPSFQWLPLYTLLPVGTMSVLIWLSHRFGRRVGYVLAGLAILNALGWGAVWVPKVIPTWLRVSPREAAAIDHVDSMIPQNAGIVVSQGIAGDFAHHSHVTMFFQTPATLSLIQPYSWVVIAPYAGIETATASQSTQIIAALARNPRARLEYVNDGIWAFRIRVSPRLAHHGMHVEGTAQRLSAALFETYGQIARRGPIRSWYTAGSASADGPILFGDYFLQPVGHYLASVRLSGHGPAVVEVWNDTTGKLLARRRPLISGSKEITLPVAVTHKDPSRSAVANHGTGPFRIQPVRAPFGNELELTVYSTSKSILRAKWVSMTAAVP